MTAEVKRNIQKAILSFHQGPLRENSLVLFKALGYPCQGFTDQPLFDRFVFEQIKSDGTQHHDIFIVMPLVNEEYQRKVLVSISREIKRSDHQVILILFRYGSKLTFSLIQQTMVGIDQVILIKDISIEMPLRAHINMLFDLCFQERLKRTDLIDLSQILKPKELSRRFYSELLNWYLWAMQIVDFPKTDDQDLDRAEKLIRLMIPLILIWMIKEKLGISVKEFEIKEVQKRYPAIGRKSEKTIYYHLILKNLFVALNMPFFVCFDQASIPDKLFFIDRLYVDLNTEYGTQGKTYKVKGLINILKDYPFTMDENSSFESEMALDPEVLSGVFENLLSSYQSNTEITARKQTGSFYTRREIVNDMVDESLIAYLKQKLEPNHLNIESRLRALFSPSIHTPIFLDAEKIILIKAIHQIKILDPACGAGAFLMGILHRLLDILTKLDPTSEYCSKTQGRKQFLIENCIYGVDIQPMAIQISKLRFLISLLVDGHQNLNDIHTNLITTNILIDLDHQPFHTEFDIIIGNPPYGIVNASNTDQEILKTYKSYETADFKINLFALFIERSIRLSKNHAFNSFMVPDTLLNLPAFKKLRAYILTHTSLKYISHFNKHLFDDVLLGKSVILQYQKNHDHQSFLFRSFESMHQYTENEINIDRIKKDMDLKFVYKSNHFEIEKLLEKLKNIKSKLNDYCEIFDGINPGNAFIKDHFITKNYIDTYSKKIIDGKCFTRYSAIHWDESYIYYNKDYVEKFKKEIEAQGKSFNARMIKKENYFISPKIITRQTADSIIATLDLNAFYTKNSVHSTRLRDEFKDQISLKIILAILNSSLINWYYQTESLESRRLFPQVKIERLRHLPIILPLSKTLYQSIEDRVDRLLTRFDIQEYEALDLLIYQLYGLSDDEVKIIQMQ